VGGARFVEWMVSSRVRLFCKPCFYTPRPGFRVFFVRLHSLCRNIVRLCIHGLLRVWFFCHILGTRVLCLPSNQRIALVCRSLLVGWAWLCCVWQVCGQPLLGFPSFTTVAYPVFFCCNWAIFFPIFKSPRSDSTGICRPNKSFQKVVLAYNSVVCFVVLII